MSREGTQGSCIAVCVGGVPGVGKSTLLQRHVTTVEPRDRVVTGSSVLREVIAPTQFGEFDGWPEARRVAAREDTILRLALKRLTTQGRLLIDGHYTLRNRTSGIVTPVFTPADRAFYQALVLVEGTVREVISWRSKDPKDRGTEYTVEIRDHLQAERAEARMLASTMGVPYLEIPAADQASGVRILSEFLNRHAPIRGTA